METEIRLYEPVVALPGLLIVKEVKKPTYKSIDEYISNFNRLLNTYKDEIPKKVVHSTSEDPRYKCRAGWWGQITLGVSSLIKKGLLSEFTINYYDQVINDYWVSRRETGLTSRQNIKDANKLIYLVLSDLEKRNIQ